MLSLHLYITFGILVNGVQFNPYMLYKTFPNDSLIYITRNNRDCMQAIISNPFPVNIGVSVTIPNIGNLETK